MSTRRRHKARLRWPSRGLFVAVVLLILARPVTLLPVTKNQCDFCFRQATGSLNYFARESGNGMRVDVCDSHRRQAPSKLTALDISYFKLLAWLVMLGPLAFALLTLGRTVFAATHPPLELGCATFALMPLLIGQLFHLLGLHLTGRIIGWVAVFLLFSAAMGIATGSLTQPLPTVPAKE